MDLKTNIHNTRTKCEILSHGIFVHKILDIKCETYGDIFEKVVLPTLNSDVFGYVDLWEKLIKDWAYRELQTITKIIVIHKFNPKVINEPREWINHWIELIENRLCELKQKFCDFKCEKEEQSNNVPSGGHKPSKLCTLSNASFEGIPSGKPMMTYISAEDIPITCPTQETIIENKENSSQQSIELSSVPHNGRGTTLNICDSPELLKTGITSVTVDNKDITSPVRKTSGNECSMLPLDGNVSFKEAYKCLVEPAIHSHSKQFINECISKLKESFREESKRLMKLRDKYSDLNKKLGISKILDEISQMKLKTFSEYLNLIGERLLEITSNSTENNISSDEKFFPSYASDLNLNIDQKNRSTSQVNHSEEDTRVPPIRTSKHNKIEFKRNLERSSIRRKELILKYFDVLPGIKKSAIKVSDHFKDNRLNILKSDFKNQINFEFQDNTDCIEVDLLEVEPALTSAKITSLLDQLNPIENNTDNPKEECVPQSTPPPRIAILTELSRPTDIPIPGQIECHFHSDPHISSFSEIKSSKTCDLVLEYGDSNIIENTSSENELIFNAFNQIRGESKPDSIPFNDVLNLGPDSGHQSEVHPSGQILPFLSDQSKKVIETLNNSDRKKLSILQTNPVLKIPILKNLIKISNKRSMSSKIESSLTMDTTLELSTPGIYKPLISIVSREEFTTFNSNNPILNNGERVEGNFKVENIVPLDEPNETEFIDIHRIENISTSISNEFQFLPKFEKQSILQVIVTLILIILNKSFVSDSNQFKSQIKLQILDSFDQTFDSNFNQLGIQRNWKKRKK